MADFSKFSNEQLNKVRDRSQTVGGVFGRVPVQEYQEGQRNILGNIFDRPAAALRAGVRGLAPGGETPIQAYKRAAISPSTEPTFQEKGIEKHYAGKEPSAMRTAGGFGVSATGLAADIATNPASLLMMIAGKVPMGKTTLGQKATATRPAQALRKFATRPRRIKTGEGLPTGSILKRKWAKFKHHPVSDVRRIERAISGKKEIAGKAMKTDRAYTTKLLEQTDDTLKQNIEVMKMDLQKSAEKGSLEFQNKLQGFIRENSRGYGKRLDEISGALSKKGENLTKGEMNNILMKTLQEAMEAELPVGRAQNVIQKLVDIKYSTTQFSKNFTFAEIMNDIKMIRGALASGVRAGRAGFAPDEVIVSVLNKNWGDVIASRVPEFAKLNKSYTPVIQAMKKSHKVFKPYAGPLETKTGTEFLKKVGAKKAEAGELRFLKQLEKGGEFAPGVGEISQPISKVGRQIKLTEAMRPIMKTKIQEKGLARQAKIQKNLQGWLDKLSGMERKAVLNQWLRRGGAAAGGMLLLHMIKQRMAGSLLDSLSGSGGSTQSGGQY